MNRKRLLKKLIIIMLCSIVSGIFVSVGTAGIEYLKSANYHGKYEVDSSQISTSGNVKAENGKYQVSEEGGKVIIHFPEEIYISKLQYQYFVEENIEQNSTIVLNTKNVYGEKTEEYMTDIYMKDIARSVVNIKNTVSEIEFDYSEMNAGVEIKEFVIDNSFKWNPIIMVVTSCTIFLLLFLLVYHKENAKHPEMSAFITILIVSTCLLALQPPYCSGWDEQIHFGRAYDLAFTMDKEGAPRAIRFLNENANWLNLHHESSIEERADLIRTINTLGKIKEGGIESHSLEISSVGYVLQAAAITVGKILGLPFYFVWLLGKYANILLYAAGMAAAIFITPIGKRFLMVVSLLPTMIFSSTTYTYDITVNVFIIMGVAILIRELFYSDRVFSRKWKYIFIVCMVIGCMPKAVYAPLILGVLILPANKYKSKKDKICFDILICVCFMLLMSTFVLPTLLSPPALGDSRGGNTSVSLQLQYVLLKPVAYAKVLWNNISKTFVEYFMGTMGIGTFAYWGRVTQPLLFAALLTGVSVTDSYVEEKRERWLTIKGKLFLLFSILMTIVLIWTALYLSFTEVGKTEIAGVQGRYYLPFLFLFYLCLKPEKIEAKYTITNYQAVIMFMSSCMLLYQVFVNFLIPCCL